jgi:hypothetical protein
VIELAGQVSNHNAAKNSANTMVEAPLAQAVPPVEEVETPDPEEDQVTQLEHLVRSKRRAADRRGIRCGQSRTVPLIVRC